MNPFETDTKGRRFVADVSINWASNTWRVTQLTLLRQECVNVQVRWKVQQYMLNNDHSDTDRMPSVTVRADSVYTRSVSDGFHVKTALSGSGLKCCSIY